MSEASEQIIRVEFPDGPFHVHRDFKMVFWEGQYHVVYCPYPRYGYDMIQDKTTGAWKAIPNDGSLGIVEIA